MMPPRRASVRRALPALLVVLAALPAGAADSSIATIDWTYEVSLAPGGGAVRVQLTIAGADDIVASFTFGTDDPDVSNVTAGANTPLKDAPGEGVRFDVDGTESFAYDVRVEENAFREGERLAHVGDDFALFKAERLQLQFRYSYYPDKPFANRTTVHLRAPDGWQARGPWALAEHGGGYVLPPDDVLPRGYVVFGPVSSETTYELAGKRYHYVRLGAPAPFEAEMARFVENATPYYEAVYGPGVAEDVLIVSAPDPMFQGGLGGTNSLFVHEDVDIKTFAHELAHVFQLFSSREDAPPTTIWLTEGDADYHSALALFTTGLWTAQQVEDFFAEARKDKSDPALRDAILSEALYGGDLERFAYHKGLLVLDALDARLRESSGGAVGLSDLLRRLNLDHGLCSTEACRAPVTNEEIARVASELAGADVSDIVSAYVLGTQWPETRSFAAAGELAVDAFEVSPARAAPGENVTVRATVANRGTSEIEQLVELRMDGAGVATRDVTLAVGGSTDILFTMQAPESPGDHQVALHNARANLTVLRPADVVATRITLDPSPYAERDTTVTFELRNRGEINGSASATILLAGHALAVSAPVVVPAEGLANVTLTLQYAAPGPANITLVLYAGTREYERNETVEVRAALPTPPSSTTPASSPTGALPPAVRPGATQVETPGAGVLGALAALCGVAVAWRRR